MTKQHLHLHIKRLHWHGSVILTALALLVTAVKTSGEFLRQLEHTHQASALAVAHLREAETRHLLMHTDLGRSVTVSGE